MPDGKTHNVYWRVCSVPVLAVTGIASLTVSRWIYQDHGLYQAIYPIEWGFWVIVWYLAGRWISPDLDILGVNADEGRILREGGLLGAFAFGYTSFYAAVMHYLADKFDIRGIAGAHRSWLTHSPIGTLIRMLFINAPLAYAHQIITQLGYGFAREDIIVFLFAQFVGLGVADGIHVFLDLYYGEKDGK